MFTKLAQLLGLSKKDPAVERRLARMKARYGVNSRDDVDPLSHVRTGFENRSVVGSAQSLDELRQSLIESYAKQVAEESAPENELELIKSS